MTLTIHRDDDACMDALKNRTVALVGYGNQGRAHAQNMRDSGITVTIGQREGGSADRARSDGFDPLPVGEVVASADLVILTLPDETAAQVYDSDVVGSLKKGQALGFVHGFNIRYGFIKPPADVDVIMIAPKGPGTLLRSLYENGRGLPALVAVEQDATGRAKAIALAWGAAIGSARAGIVETTFACETETDLFGEQVALCGGVTALTKAAFETLVEAGYEPEFAYLECVHELKQIVDLIYAHGLTAMRERISNTAEYGDLTRGPTLINEQTREQMRRILADVQSGAFAKEWVEQWRSGGKKFRSLREADRDSAFERAGREVRKLMPWLGQQ